MTSPLRGATAVVGVGTSSLYRRGGSPEGELTLTVRAVMAACADAGIHPGDVDGFTSYGGCVSAASDWGAPCVRKRVLPSRADS